MKYTDFKTISTTDEKINNNPKSRNPKDILQNEHNPMKAPFGLKSKRFTWQTESSYNSVNELNGTLKNYSLNGVVSYCIEPTVSDNGSVSLSDWEHSGLKCTLVGRHQ